MWIFAGDFPPTNNVHKNLPMLQKRTYTKEQALQRLKHYCAYQERCHLEVKEKAYSLGLQKSEVEELVSRLIEEDYLNEERFSIQFAGGKFRMKQWGRNKIRKELMQRKISEYCIRKALAEIDEKEYQQVLEKLAQKKWTSLKDTRINQVVKMKKTSDFLLQKGFEPEQVQSAISQLKN